MLLEVYQGRKQNNVTLEKYIISKADWEVWKTCTEEKFKVWNEADTQFDTLDDMAEAFMNIYTDCMTEAVPKKEVKL